MIKYCFDLDETICLTPSSRKYEEAVPLYPVIHKINELYNAGNIITIFTARGNTSGVDYNQLTKSQLEKWGVSYNKLIDKNKPDFDLLIDDKAINSKTWREQEKVKIVGFVCGAFDLLHSGHCLYLKEAKSICDWLIVGLHSNPRLDRSEKNVPVQSIEERTIQLESLKYVDQVEVYDTEKDLETLLKHIRPNVRILGSDCRGKKITGEEFCDAVYYHERSHEWSSSDLRKRCLQNVK